MKYGKKILTIIFAVLVLSAGLVLEASAQRRGVYIQRTTSRPVIVRRYIYRDPFWRSRYYSGFYDPFYYSPYLRHQEQRYYLQRELAGNRRELAEHQRKYRADGVITAKEQRELEDDYRDVSRSIERLSRFRRNY